HDSSISGFCGNLFAAIDEVLGTNHYERANKGRTTIERLQITLEKVIRSEFVGVVIIDAMENLSVSKSGGAAKLIGYINNLIDQSGVPFLFIDNPPADRIFKETK